MRHSIRSAAVSSAAVLAVLAGFSVAASAKDFSPAVAKVIAQANKEGQLNVSWSNTAFEGGRGARAFEEGMNGYFGTHIHFNYSPGAGFPAVARKLAQELGAGMKSFADVALAGEGQVNFYIKNKVLRSIDWSPLMPQIPAATVKKIVAPDNTLVTLYSRMRTIMYNTQYIKKADAPKRLIDMLNPKWKGKVATTPYAAGFGSLPDDPNWTRQKVLDFAHKLSANLGGLIRCGEIERIASGEFWVFAPTCEPSLIQRLIDKGAPVAQRVPLDAMRIDHWYLGVPKNAVHPASATLLIAWLLTRQGQEVLYKYQGGDLHFLKGSHTGKEIRALEKEAGRKFVAQTIKVTMSQKGQSSLQRAAAKILRKKK